MVISAGEAAGAWAIVASAIITCGPSAGHSSADTFGPGYSNGVPEGDLAKARDVLAGVFDDVLISEWLSIRARSSGSRRSSALRRRCANSRAPNAKTKRRRRTRSSPLPSSRSARRAASPIKSRRDWRLRRIAGTRPVHEWLGRGPLRVGRGARARALEGDRGGGVRGAARAGGDVGWRGGRF